MDEIQADQSNSTYTLILDGPTLLYDMTQTYFNAKLCEQTTQDQLVENDKTPEGHCA